ncbi:MULTISPECIES: SDR family NAD(P)-dependent oxidoreductase [Microbacterium]|uniref:SDR family NAD(P)-dependent oxidoreductase n=1 Tax=Microbacterium wangchenii TaxID=2541726 RepID=A0ABX5ST34_9MICO|nr:MULTISPECIES: SDR family NAD(P)-dependent oxidoreductase [Microbacterium]MCK6067784.1 SDR family NAD(P)-dependent oxidoreductase [Microbacterium sp. EYE_512]QBR89311.1 SDR family NAD(P)-dependent oxidoreductase [Microbacterium wangchenii]TXK10984.1 SDR family NAD(P)-dependent oxidoreductase [Microbacterium wangchenii]
MTITLITGANRGIGYETARQLRERGHEVYLGARDIDRGRRAAETIGARFVELDVTDDASVAGAVATIEATEGRLDVLVNNAGVLDLGDVDGPRALRSFDINAVGLIRVTEAALPLLRRSERPTVVNVTSSMGSFWAVTNPERVEHGLPNALYAASKAAANMLTVQYAKAHPGVGFTAIEPGFTDTEMTASLGGGRPAAESAAVIVGLATRERGPSGTFHDERGLLAW